MSENSRIFMYLTDAGAHVKGECTVDEYEEWIELDSWNWDMDRASQTSLVGRPSVLSVSKLMDKLTTPMLKAMSDGKKLRAKLVVDDGSVDMLFELSMELDDLTIKDYSVSTSVNEKGATVDEDWVFDYRTITFKHQVDPKSGTKTIKLERPQDADSTVPGGVKKAEFKKLGLEILTSGVALEDLEDLWKQIKKAHEEEKNKPDGKSPEHAGTTKTGVN